MDRPSQRSDDSGSAKRRTPTQAGLDATLAALAMKWRFRADRALRGNDKPTARVFTALADDLDGIAAAPSTGDTEKP